MKYLITITLASTSALALMASATFAGTAGFQPLEFDAPHHGRYVTGGIWFPSDGTGEQITFAENPVFHGVKLQKNSAIASGSYPVILYSHGMGGNILSSAWLATALAERGAIVIAVNHPNTTWRDFDLKEGAKHWTRTQDLSLALDTVLQNDRFASQIDNQRIMAAGFSYGGYTALSMGGLLGNHEGSVTHCQTYGDASTACDRLLSERVKFQSLDSSEWNASYKDRRITQVFAMDPGLVWGHEAKSTENLVDRVTLLGLGDGDDRLLAADFDASGFADLLPNAEVIRIAPANHFTALPLCKPMGEMILAEEKDDPVCTDPEGANRAKVHQQIINSIASDLGL